MTMIFESPDKGKTVYMREFGSLNRTLVSSSNESLQMIHIPVSLGELVDKITILHIKLTEITDAEKVKNIQKEFYLLTGLDVYTELEHELKEYYQRLFDVNYEIWRLEDVIRECESSGRFDDYFVESSRQIHKANKKRSQIKKEINIKYKSQVVEEKSYKD